MQTYWLHRDGESARLIVVFGGFASQPSHFAHLRAQSHVLLCANYHDFSYNIDTASYSEVWLVAYSMGVSVAAMLFDTMQCSRKIALNGTNYGIHKSFGIHPRIFCYTIEHFNLDHFKRALFGDQIHRAGHFEFAPPQALKAELQSLYDFCATRENAAFTWDKIYIATHDSLFLPEVCRAAFSNQEHILCELPTPHFPFFHFQTWEEICAID